MCLLGLAGWECPFSRLNWNLSGPPIKVKVDRSDWFELTGWRQESWSVQNITIIIGVEARRRSWLSATHWWVCFYELTPTVHRTCSYICLLRSKWINKIHLKGGAYDHHHICDKHCKMKPLSAVDIQRKWECEFDGVTSSLSN